MLDVTRVTTKFLDNRFKSMIKEEKACLLLLVQSESRTSILSLTSPPSSSRDRASACRRPCAWPSAWTAWGRTRCPAGRDAVRPCTAVASAPSRGWSPSTWPRPLPPGSWRPCNASDVNDNNRIFGLRSMCLVYSLLITKIWHYKKYAEHHTQIYSWRKRWTF